MTAPVARTVGIIVGCLLLAGCAGPAVESTREATAVVGSPTDEGMDGRLIGTAMVEHGCWVIRGDDDAVHHVFWPTGTILVEGGIQVPGVADPIADGNPVRAAGGEIAASGLPTLEHDCWGDGDVVFSAWRVELDPAREAR